MSNTTFIDWYLPSKSNHCEIHTLHPWLAISWSKLQIFSKLFQQICRHLHGTRRRIALVFCRRVHHRLGLNRVYIPYVWYWCKNFSQIDVFYVCGRFACNRKALAFCRSAPQITSCDWWVCRLITTLSGRIDHVPLLLPEAILQNGCLLRNFILTCVIELWIE